MITKKTTSRWNRLRALRSHYDVEADVTICRGFPIIAFANIERGDPSVGLGDTVTDPVIFTQDLRSATFLASSMSVDDEDRIFEALISAIPC